MWDRAQLTVRWNSTELVPTGRVVRDLNTFPLVKYHQICGNQVRGTAIVSVDRANDLYEPR